MTIITMKSLGILVIIAFSVIYGEGREGTTVSPVSTTFVPIDFAKARDEIVENLKRQYNDLKNLSQEFQHMFANETKPLQDFFADMKERVAWYFREPTEAETTKLDKILDEFLPFGGDESGYLDTNEKMEKFCKEHDNHLDSLRSWLRRKYKSLTIQISFNMVISKIDHISNQYCNSTQSKADYVSNIQKFKAVNSKIIPAKDDLLDAIEFIKNATYKAPKIGRVCCTYWEYLKSIKESVGEPKAAEFGVHLIKNYFSTATNYLCVLFPDGDKSICKEEEKSPKVEHKFKSLIMQMILTLSEIVGVNNG